MLIVYDSRTGNVQRFVNKLGIESVKVTKGLSIDEPFVLITYTDNFGEIPKSTLDFLERNHYNLVGVAASGNRNWGNNYAISAVKISKMYGVPVLLQFELSGMQGDIDQFRERLTGLARH